jgi:hypothetical protein
MKNSANGISGSMWLDLPAFSGFSRSHGVQPSLPSNPPARDSFPAAQVAKAKAWPVPDIARCTTHVPGAGVRRRLGLQTPFGTIYSTNITPHANAREALAEAAVKKALKASASARVDLGW